MLENDWKFRKDSLLLRDALCEFFECRYGKIRFLEEKNIGKVRADMIAVRPDGLLGMEIKSHSDSYDRLKNQVQGYDTFCDYNFLCAGSTHIRAAEHVPTYWGILSMTVRDGVRFEVLREPSENPKCRILRQTELLWYDELAYILKIQNLPKYTGKSKKFICTKLCEKLSPEILKPLLCDRLFERDYTRYQNITKSKRHPHSGG